MTRSMGWIAIVVVVVAVVVVAVPACGGNIDPPAIDAAVIDAPDTPIDAPDDAAIDGPDAAMTAPAQTFSTGGGGAASSANFRVELRIGAPQPMGSAASAGFRATLGPTTP